MKKAIELLLQEIKKQKEIASINKLLFRQLKDECGNYNNEYLQNEREAISVITELQNAIKILEKQK